MEIKQLPKRLQDITLEKWVGWHTAYGDALLKKAELVSGDDAMLLFETEFAIKHYAWYSDTSLVDVEAAAYREVDSCVVEIVKEASLSQASLFRDMLNMGQLNLVESEFVFDKKVWRIVPPLNIADYKSLTIPEFERSQDVALVLSDLQDGKYEALYELCTLYLQSDKKYIPTIDYAKSLPLSIALCVKRYVEETIYLYNSLTNDREPAIT